MAFDKDGNLLIGLASAIRGISSVTGGAVGCPTPHGCAVRGIYRQTGATWTLLRATNIRGTNEVAVDPNNSNILYQSSFAEGIWRSLDNGATWTQIKPALNPANNADRAEFALNKLPGGKTRMYVGDGNSSDAGANRARFWRTDDAAGAAVFTDMTTAQNIGYCTAQCWYDNVVYSPPGRARRRLPRRLVLVRAAARLSNGRAVLQSIDGGATFSDMTLDSDNSGWLHPDQHALTTIPGEPLQWIAGDDGGVVRPNGTYVDASAQCDSRGLNAADTAFCKSLLSRIPEQTANLNKGLSTLQFQSFSVDPKHPQNSLMGGTQDNGTFEYSGSSEVWPQIIYGDGGQSGWNAADSTLRFNSFFGQNHDANFRNGDPTKWVIISGKIAGSPEGSNFYAPIIADPNPATAGSIFEGSQSVWRTQDWGGDRASSRRTAPSSRPPATTRPAVTSSGSGRRVRPTSRSAAYGADRARRCVVGRRAGTEQHRHAVGGDEHRPRVHLRQRERRPAASVVWTRLDPSATERPEPVRQLDLRRPGEPAPRVDLLLRLQHQHAGPARATCSRSPGSAGRRRGPTAVQPGRPAGHRPRPRRRDRRPLRGDRLRRDEAGHRRHVVDGRGRRMPMVEVPGLTIVPNARVLYAATHGLGGWQLDLGKWVRADRANGKGPPPGGPSRQRPLPAGRRLVQG